ncbi:MAG: Uma2 family endonuclease [Acidobacteria bacterium]|nr:Uma2 family endonuclease [Acidobacteriota bacterium]
MTFEINEAFLPATLTCPPMTDEAFSAFCNEHPDLDFEMTAEGELIVMAPTHSDTGAQNFETAAQLRNWAKKDHRGVGCDSSTGFVLPNGARRSPDASWTLKSRIAQLGTNKRHAFWQLCPDFVIEIRSASDRLKPRQGKMREYLEQGAQLGWLIDPESRTVEVYRTTGPVELYTNLDTLVATSPLDGFILDLAPIWDPLAD